MRRGKYTVDSFFAGVGGIDLGFKQSGSFKTIWANEIDKWAQQTYHLNFPKVTLNPHDINKVSASRVPSADIMVGGFPCQSFSIAGFRKGFDDPRGVLFFQMLRMIKTHRPKAVLLENVKNLVGFHNGREFKIIRDALIESGYYLKWKVMDSSKYGNVPQHRERIYVVGFRSKDAFNHFHFPKPIKLTKSIHDVVDFAHPVNKKYYYTRNDYIYPRLAPVINSSNHIYEYRRGSVRKIKSNISPAITSICGEGGDNTPIIYTFHHHIRSITPREAFNIQGFPKSYKLNESKMHLYKQAGNAVSVPVIRRIASHIACALSYATAKSMHHISYNSKYYLFVDMPNKYCGESYLITKRASHQYKLISNSAYTRNIRLNKPIYGCILENATSNFLNEGSDTVE